MFRVSVCVFVCAWVCVCVCVATYYLHLKCLFGGKLRKKPAGESIKKGYKLFGEKPKMICQDLLKSK